MKKYLLLFVSVIVLNSCSIDSDNPPNFFLEIMPIQSVNVPDEFTHGQTYEISMIYTRPNSCYQFHDFVYQSQENERNVAIVDAVLTDIECSEIAESVTVSFDFVVTSFETYVFKFYQGEGDNEEDQYLIVEVPVVE